MNRKLIAIMLGATITSTTLAGCSKSGKGTDEIKRENDIRELLEYDANTNLDKVNVENYGLKVEYEIKDEKFYITFITSKPSSTTFAKLVDDIKITYEVDKDTYYDFRHNYNLKETSHEVGRVKNLTEQYDPIEVLESEKQTVKQ